MKKLLMGFLILVGIHTIARKIYLYKYGEYGGHLDMPCEFEEKQVLYEPNDAQKKVLLAIQVINDGVLDRMMRQPVYVERKK